MADLKKMTVKELRNYAEKNKINLQGRDKKADIYATIKAAESAKSPSVLHLEEECGQAHIDAVKHDHDACVKAQAKADKAGG